MDPFLRNLLIGHVVLGLAGIVTSAMSFIILTKTSNVRRRLRFSSLFSVVFFLASWFLGGQYYVSYYGKSVKPIIKAGDYAWAHSFVMEFKEHVFLFLPFLSVAVFLAIWLMPRGMKDAAGIGRNFLAVNFLLLFIGISVLLMGALISGAVQ